jgi:hypothetical protein
MASIIRIKRSSVSGNPATLGAGELAYSALTDNGSNGGDRLYIGIGAETSGNAANHFVIGGKFFTDRLDHTAGTLTASSAIVVDSDSKVDNLKVDNLDLNGNTLSASNTNGNLTLAANGTGFIDISTGVVKIASTSAATNTTSGALQVAGGVGIVGALYVGGAISAESASFASINNTPIGNTTPSTGAFTQLDVDNIRIDGNAITSTNTDGNITVTPNGTGKTVISNLFIGNDTTSIAEFIYDTVGGAVTGGTGITITNDDGANTSTVSITNTGVTAATYGSSTEIPVLAINAQGQVTSATFASITTSLGIAADSGSDTIALATDTLTFAGGEGIDTAVNSSTNTVTISAEDASTSNKGVASFADADFNVTTGAVELKDTVVKSITTDSGALTPSSHALSVLGGEGIDVTHTGTTITVAGEDATTTNKGVASFADANFTVSSGAVSTKTITLGTSTLTNGSTTSTLAGLQQLDVDNIRVDGNTISATNENGSITLAPTGTGTVDVSGKRITSVAEPTQAQDAATKAYVDSLSNGLDVKASVKAGTTTALTATYDNGTSGVGATLTNAGTQAALTLDSIALSIGDRVLIKDQASALQNGVYTVTTVGTISTNWVLTRATDFDNSPGTEVSPGTFFFVEQGTSNADNGYVISTNEAITIGTTDIVFSQFSGAGQITAGDGLTKTGNTINAVGTADRISITADAIDIASTYVGQSSITTLGTIATGTWQGTVVDPTYGGTGVNNGTKTITLGGSFTHTGAHTLGVTTTANTSVTLPTTGTLATLAGTEALSNKTITSSSFSGTTIAGSGLISFTDTTDAGPLGTAAVVMAGGLSVAKKIYVGSNIIGAGAATSTLDGFNIDGGTY